MNESHAKQGNRSRTSHKRALTRVADPLLGVYYSEILSCCSISMVSNEIETALKETTEDLEPVKEASRPVHRPITIRNPPHTYLHLTLITSSAFIQPSSKAPPIDILTARTYLTSALNQFLGLTGTAIPVDFLKVEGRDVWIRVPREDGAAVVGAMSHFMGSNSAVSWRVRGKGEWLGAVGAGDGSQLFET